MAANFSFFSQHAYFHMSLEYNTCGYMVQQMWKTALNDPSDILAGTLFDPFGVVGQDEWF